jgi:hypothetical protein
MWIAEEVETSTSSAFIPYLGYRGQRDSYRRKRVKSVAGRMDRTRQTFYTGRVVGTGVNSASERSFEAKPGCFYK